MARWDEILTLPVQNPPTLEFSSSDLVWSKVEGWRDNIDRVALIPFARVDDFVRGESSNKDCPTRFHVEARRRRPPEMAYKPKVDGILEYILYWCSFGPDDHRKGGIVRPSRSTYVPKNKTAGRPNTKRGCTCHFIVKRLIAEPTVALVIYNQEKHVDKKGLPCHGPQDKKAAGTRAMFAPYISDDLRLRVLSLLYVGVSVETIMQRHNESVEKQGGPCNRDDLLTHRYVRRQERSIRRSTYELDADDAVSLSMWVESHQSQVFFYEDFSHSEPFILGIQTEWQLQQMIRFGNRSLVASDSRFGTNKLKYPVHSLLVFDSDNKAIPVAWIITPRFANGDSDKWIRALYNRVHTKDPTWKLAGFIVDDPSTDVLTIREVFQCSVLICFWRVRHAWHKNLVKKCSETVMRSEISRQLGQAVYSICRGNGDVDLFENFMDDFVDCLEFLDYFKAVWYPRIGMWTTALKTLPLASQETCAAMEFYHNQLKLRLLNEKDPSVYQRADWLVDKLGTKVHSYFWLDEYSGKDDFARYWKDEWISGLTSWRRAFEIPDSDVALDGRCAKVISQHDRERTHVVWNPGSEFAICDCKWSGMGNLCKHVVKVSRVCRDKGSAIPSISLFEYNQALIKMSHCPPQDSLIHDHAISLAICVQMQLNALLDQKSRETAIGPIDKQTVGGGSANGGRDVNEGHCRNENILSSNENGVGVVNETLDGSAVDLSGGKMIDGVGIENGVCGESLEQVVACTSMDVDSLSISASPSGLLPIDEVAIVDGFLENGDSDLRNADLTMGENQPLHDDDFSIRNVLQDVVFDKDCNNEVIGNGICKDVLQKAISNKMMSSIEIAMVSGLTMGENQPLHDDDFSIRNVLQDGIFDKDCNNEVIGNGICKDVLQKTISSSLMDVDPESIETPLSKLVDVEQCMFAADNGVCRNVADSTVIGDTLDVDQQLISLPIELQRVSVIESPHAISENGGMDFQNENEGPSKNLSPGNAFIMDDVQGGLADEFCHGDVVDQLVIENGVCGQDAEGAGNMELQPESTQTSLSKSSSNEYQLLLEPVACETGVCDDVMEKRGPANMIDATLQPIQVSSSSLDIKQLTVTESGSVSDIPENGDENATNVSQTRNDKHSSSAIPSLTRCGVKDAIADGYCHSEETSQLVSEKSVDHDIAEETVSGQSIQASLSRAGTFKQQTVNGDAASDNTFPIATAKQTISVDKMDVDAEPVQT